MTPQTSPVEGKKYTVSCGIEMVYFIDLNEDIDEDIEEEQKVIDDSVKEGVEKNVFFIKKGKIKDSVYIPELKLENFVF